METGVVSRRRSIQLSTTIHRMNVVHLQSRFRSADEGVAFRGFRPARTAPEPADDTKNGHVDSVCTWSRSPLGCRVAATNADRCRPNCDRRKPSRCMHRPRRTVQPHCADHPRRPNAVLRLSRTSPYTLPPPGRLPLVKVRRLDQCFGYG